LKLRCAILDDYQGVALDMADWGRLSPEVEVQVFREKIDGLDNLVRALKDFEILCLMRERTPIPAKLIEGLPKLRLIMSTGGQNLSIDVAAANQRNITVCGTSALSHPTVELTFALMLELARRAGRESDGMKNGKLWQDSVGMDLCGKTLGIIGLGRLGTKVAGIAHAFGMRVVAWSPNLTPDKCAEAAVRYATKEQLFSAADIVSVHMQLSASTRHIIDADELARMKRSALLINTSRGPLINETALLDALRKETIAGFGVDVYDEEPLSAGHPFRGLANVVMTPHIGFVTADNYRTYYGGAVEGIRAWLDGKPIRIAKPVTDGI
jgi:phosphoglycerate dehydrogenase-like enzyme